MIDGTGIHLSLPEHAVDVSVVEEEDRVKSRRFIFSHVATTSHDLQVTEQQVAARFHLVLCEMSMSELQEGWSRSTWHCGERRLKRV